MRLVVLGGGESGVGTAILGKKKGYDVFVSDFGKIKENCLSTDSIRNAFRILENCRQPFKR
jgi:UDP-N-acetylmuramoylalanine--D-glutamate ligase